MPVLGRSSLKQQNQSYSPRSLVWPPLGLAISQFPMVGECFEPDSPSQSSGFGRKLSAELIQPASLLPLGHPDRPGQLQQLRRAPELELEPWLGAIEAGTVAVDSALLSIFADRLDAKSCLRLMRWWWQQSQPDPQWPAVFCRVRDPELAAWLRGLLGHGAPALTASLLPLLGYQRQPQDFSLLADFVLAPQPVGIRRAALEALAVGLGAWPTAPLRRLLRALVGDLDSSLAASALDLLARLPRARSDLFALQRHPLEPGVGQRLQRRLAALPPSPLLLVIHGRAGGIVPLELQAFAGELARKRGAPVLLQALTGEPPGPPEVSTGPPAGPLTLVPLFLLPGGHVRNDIPAIAASWRRHGPLRLLPFLGSWPLWQQALVDALAEEGFGKHKFDSREDCGQLQPLVLHHPLEGPLARRYLNHLQRRTGAQFLAAAYSEPLSEMVMARVNPAPEGPAPVVLPLVLSANRLTDSLSALVGPPLLERPRFQQLLMQQLEALP